MTPVAIDIGFSHTKALTNKRSTIFPSVVGETQALVPGLGSSNNHIKLNIGDNESWFVGQIAIEQSGQPAIWQDHNWIETPEYRALLLAAVSELSSSTNLPLNLITGLPIRHFKDRQRLAELFQHQDFTIKRGGRKAAQKIKIERMIFLPQALAAILGHAMDDKGNVKPNSRAALGTVGGIDVGGHTIGFSTVCELNPVSVQTDSINGSVWNVLGEISKQIADQWPGYELAGHELVEVIKSQKVTPWGEEQDVSELINDTVAPFARRILSGATRFWGNGSKLQEILIFGGGAEIIGPALARYYPNAAILDNPQWANVVGYFKYGKRLLGK